MSTSVKQKNSVKRFFQNNVLALFFIRLGVISVTVTLLGISSIYWYIERENAKRIDALINKEFIDFEKHLKGLELGNLETRKLFISRMNELMESHQMLILDIRETDGTELFAVAKTPDTDMVQLFRRFDPDVSETISYHLVPADPDNLILIFAKSLPINHTSTIVLKAAIPLKSETVLAMRKGMRIVFIGTTVILLLVIVAIFPIIYRQYRQLQSDKTELLYSNFNLVRVLGDVVAMRDSDTSEHNYRVTYYTIRLAEKMNVPPEALPALIKGAFLHDVGKIGISDTILLKPGRLDENEFSIMKQHVDLGTALIQKIPWCDDALAVIGFHHEKFDGSGYPNGLKGEEIPLTARIFAVVDVFDALVSVRPYKQAFTFQHAIESIREGSGRHFDPMVVISFCDIAECILNDVSDKNIDELEKLIREAISPYALILGYGRMTD
ncbi:metal dependent phosphohydrolase [Sulfuricurvum kujiense DSM 16994]|uniref:Metal dependent phosphohydrolase n=1 Tax=Sulfuricurvum kujiense (strain ATCC BAA-921 / DSM 16994 / JCM 11577 / YK-1) TaxID=709032 RepID=E4U128_SULKY|nr:HD-GYP domain-containing protein [Sulfuricurvum kujiense]ADR34430.1 metal dependent phosphohydrolase [Sulfuricurvum kujiense DSM 16994]